MSQNLYSYCGNNPTNYVDPTGHFPILLALLIVAAAFTMSRYAEFQLAETMETIGDLDDVNDGASAVEGTMETTTCSKMTDINDRANVYRSGYQGTEDPQTMYLAPVYLKKFEGETDEDVARAYRNQLETVNGYIANTTMAGDSFNMYMTGNTIKFAVDTATDTSVGEYIINPGDAALAEMYNQLNSINPEIQFALVQNYMGVD